MNNQVDLTQFHRSPVNKEDKTLKISPNEETDKIDFTQYHRKTEPEFEGSALAEGFKQGSRGIATLLPQVGKIATSYANQPNEEMSPLQKVKQKTFQTVSHIPGVQSFINSASNMYDLNPDLFGRSHVQKKAEEGKPIPEHIQKSLGFKIGEFAGMDAPFLAFDIASAGASTVFRKGIIGAAEYGAKNLVRKGALSRGANAALGVTAKPALAGTVSKTLTDFGAPEWLADLAAVPIGYWAIPKAVDKAGAYVLENATKNLLKKRSGTSTQGISPSFANTGEGAATEIALGVLQKDAATRNIMKEFVAGQDKEFGDSLLSVIGENNYLIDEAENFLTDILESETNKLSEAESNLAKQEQNLGDESQALDMKIKSLETGLQEEQESATQLIEDIESPTLKSNPQKVQEITKKGRDALGTDTVGVSDKIISNAARTIQGEAKTPEDLEAAKLIGNIPMTKENPERAVETIYNSIYPRIGQPEAGEIYKASREEAYQIANKEKREMYLDLQRAAEESTYQIPELPFRQLTNQMRNIIKSFDELSFKSPTQERAFSHLKDLYASFEDPGISIDFGDGIEMLPGTPSILKLWDARKSLGQSINWKSNQPGEKVLKDQYGKFNNLLQSQMKKAGLYDLYESANQNYIQRYLPLESGTNGKVKFMNPSEAGRSLNLQSISAMEPFLPLDKLNPLRRHAIEKVIGHPSPGELPYREIQKLENVKRFLTPNEQSQFYALQDMPLIQAKVSTKKLGEIEVFLEENRSNLTAPVIKQLENVTKELRSRSDLPVDYLTGRAQLEEMEKASKMLLEAEKSQQKKDVTALKRDVRNKKYETKSEIDEILNQKKTINEQTKDIRGQIKEVNRQQAKLQKSLLNTMLQQDTNRALLNEMSTIDGIREVKKMLGSSPNANKIFEGLKQMKAQKIFENALSINSIVKLMKNEKSKVLLKELLSEPQFNKVQKLSELAQTLQERFRYYVNQSNTEVQRSHMRELSELVKGISRSLVKGSAVGLLGIGSKFLVKRETKKKIARLMTDPQSMQDMLDWMIKMKKDATSKSTMKSGDKLVRQLIKSGYISKEEANNQEKSR